MVSRRLEPQAFSTVIYGGQNENSTAEAKNTRKKTKKERFEKSHQRQVHTSYLSRAPQVYSCKFFLAGVNFYRFNAKNWQFTVYFAVITQKIGNFLCILS